VAARRISPDLIARLASFRVSGTRSGILLVRGLPVEQPVPPTPTDGAYAGPWTELAVSTLTQLMLMSLLGGVISYADEKSGRLVQDVCPVPGAEDRQENTGSGILELHTEDGFHPHKPDFLSLYCLRQDHDRTALTVAGGIREVLPLLPDDYVEALREPIYRIRLSSSFAGDGPARYSARLPVLSGPVDDPDMCVDFHAMEPLDERGTRAFGSLREKLMRALIGVALQPGDLLIVDNRLAAHGRTGFSPRYDGTDRWLRRCFAVSDIRASRGMRYATSRVHRPLQINR
jgi:L-asparagine oxygenase